MSVTDPLLKQLKGLILEFRLSQTVINDKTEKLHPLCDVIEKIFRKGLKNNGSWFSKTDYWCWVSKAAYDVAYDRVNPIFIMVTSIVNESKKVCTLQGKGRLFIRCALVKKVLGVAVELLRRDLRFTDVWYDAEFSILGNEILSEIFISLLFEITEIKFLLNLKNASFLDETWDLPVYKEYELVPCDDIGMTVQYLSGRTLVISVVPGSVAEEDGKVGCGDVLDELFDISLRNANKSKVQQILRQNKGWPIRLSVSKCLKENHIYGPIEELLTMANLQRDQINIAPKKKCPIRSDEDNEGEEEEEEETDFFHPMAEKGRKPAHALLPGDYSDEIPVHGPEQKAFYPVLFIEEVFVGNKGGQKEILDVIGQSMVNYPGKQQPLLLQLGETEVLVMTRDKKQAVYRHCYTEISSCGRRMDTLKIFAYICGETTCSIAQSFKCHIFEAETIEDAKIILCAIGQGFHRTTFYV
ncbi:RUN and FYVE domain-containing 4-like [Argonauta hians]